MIRSKLETRLKGFTPTLGKKLFAGFAVLVVVIVVCVGVSDAVSSRLASATANITQRAEPDLALGYSIGQAASTLTGEQSRYVLDGGKAVGGFSQATQNFEDGIAAIDNATHHDSQQWARLKTAVNSAYAAFTTNNAKIFTLVSEHKESAAMALASGAQTVAAGDQLEAAAQRYITLARGEQRTALASFNSAKAAGELIEIVLAVVAVLIALLVGFVLTRGIKRSARTVLESLRSLHEHCASDLCSALGQMADGDLTREVTPETVQIERIGRDELGQIATAVNGIRERLVASVDAYNRTRESLKVMLGNVADTANTVGASSEQMAASSEEGGRANGEIARAVDDIAAGAERQAHMIEQAKTSIEQVVEAATSSADHARVTAEAALDTRDVTRTGVGAAQQASEVMRSVRDSSLAVNSAIGELAAKSDQIGRIVETITGIAKQTNLLALNAAIEAARAGEEGRSFAVVAEHVRALAEESQVAAHEIAELIGAIQTETASAVEVVEEGARRTEEGSQAVEETREAFARIGESIDDMTARIESIAAGSQQIANSAKAMYESVSEVASVAEQSSAATQQASAATEQTYASAQEIAARAHHLSTNAEELNKLVRRFKLAY